MNDGKVDDAARTQLERDVVAHWRIFDKDGAMSYNQPVLLASTRK